MAQHDSTTPKPERDSWSTPDYIFKWLDDIFDFDVDLAADEHNTKCRLNHFTADDDGVKQHWSYFGKTGWLNPPYSKIAPWISKAIQEQKDNRFTTVMLIPTPNGESYYREIFKHASDIIFITGRLSFIDANGKPKSGNTRGSCIVVFGHRFGSINVSHVNRNDLIKLEN